MNLDTPGRDSTVSTERLFHASTHEIFAAFGQPKVLAKWWGPEGFTNTFEHFDFTAGGQWAFVMHGPNGANYPNESAFREIERDTKIVIEHVVKPRYRLTITLIPEIEGTRLQWVQEFESPEFAAKMRSLSSKANEQVLDRLEAVLSGTAL